jgi:hypothetical protein
MMSAAVMRRRPAFASVSMRAATDSVAFVGGRRADVSFVLVLDYS